MYVSVKIIEKAADALATARKDGTNQLDAVREALEAEGVGERDICRATRMVGWEDAQRRTRRREAWEGCPQCGSDAIQSMGTLGDTNHYRCRDCGWVHGRGAEG